jgi:hypothetical protein
LGKDSKELPGEEAEAVGNDQRLRITFFWHDLLVVLRHIEEDLTAKQVIVFDEVRQQSVFASNKIGMITEKW